MTNTLSRKKELFVPIQKGHAGMYVCGPTVYGDAHLGHARPGVTYDVLFTLDFHLLNVYVAVPVVFDAPEPL